MLVRTGSQLHNIAMAGPSSGIYSSSGLPLTIRSEAEAFHILRISYKQP